MRQKRSLGQVFLKSKNYIYRIVDSLDIEGQKVVEIGPGRGEITYLLSQKAKSLCAVELDRRLLGYLTKKFSDVSNVEVVAADILQFPISKVGSSLIVFGNVPYHISSRLIDYFVDYRASIKRAYLTFQKEFAAKLLAKPGDSQYGPISCYLQYYAKVKKNFDIPARAFFPKPKVSSTFITVDFYKQPPHKADDEEFLFKVINSFFNQRRKKIVNLLDIKGDKTKFLSQLGINPNLRPQQLSLENYIAITNSGQII